MGRLHYLVKIMPWVVGGLAYGGYLRVRALWAKK